MASYSAKKVGDNGITTQPIIVRFNTFRDRTKFYKKRKYIPEKFGVVLDLTKERSELLKEARVLIQNVNTIKFAYADINCNLRVFTTSGKHLFFESISVLHDIISQM